MKILLVSMPSIHFYRWTDQLKNEGHEILWFDIIDGGKKVEQLNWVKQFVGWKLKRNYFGRYFVKSKFRKLYRFLQRFNENDTAKEFERVLKKENPDIVHSFALYVSCTPIYQTMMKYRDIKWVYSSWGSDLYYFQNQREYLKDIKTVLPRVNYLFTDCKRDFKIAKKHGFKGELLGVFPGGGGFNYEETDKYVRPVLERKTILVKGYQGRSGRAIQVLQAIELILDTLQKFQIIVFGADDEVEDYIHNNKLSDKISVIVLSRNNFLPHDKILKMMGEALIYIGNSNSDGMPNTLLEAVVQGAFPIQSNPGGASSEVITNCKNGFLIEDCNNLEEITGLIIKAVSNIDLIEKAFQINQKQVKPQFERMLIKNQILNAYKKV